MRQTLSALSQVAIKRTLQATVEHIAAGRLDAARRTLEADKAAMRVPVAWNILGDIHLRLGRPAEALAAFDTALRMMPRFPEAHANRGAALLHLGRLEDALAAEDRALQGRPDSAVAHFHRGDALRALGRRDEALAAYDRALTAQPAFPEALLRRGMALMEDNRAADALGDFGRLLALQPGMSLARVQMALAHRDLGQHDRALAVIDVALAAEPDDRRALLARSSILIAARRFDDALVAADRAVAVAPDDHEAHAGRALALGELGRFDEELEALRSAEERGASSGAFHHARAIALTELGRFDEALASYDRAVERSPAAAIIRYQGACLRLLLGDFATGLAEHEWRRKIPEYHPYRRFEDAAPPWRGEDIAGKRVLLFSEQGLGDAIQFARYVPLVKARGAEVTLFARHALGPLIRASFPDVDIIGPGEEPRGLDCQAPLMSLPLVFGTRPDTIPAAVPYLVADGRRVAKWGDRLSDRGFKVGIAWSGNPKFPRNRYRSVPLGSFAPLAAIAGVRLISLQAVQGLDQLDNLPAGMAVETLGPEVTDNPDGFSEIAAVMANLDLVVSSDTAMVHLAGAFARPIWVALRDVPDWRWLLDRSDSPWYPTMRLFRQTTRGDWAGVFAEMAAELTVLVRSREMPSG